MPLFLPYQAKQAIKMNAILPQPVAGKISFSKYIFSNRYTCAFWPVQRKQRLGSLLVLAGHG